MALNHTATKTRNEGDRAIVTTISEEHVKLKFGDHTVDVSRKWWHRLRARSRLPQLMKKASAVVHGFSSLARLFVPRAVRSRKHRCPFDMDI